MSTFLLTLSVFLSAEPSPLGAEDWLRQARDAKGVDHLFFVQQALKLDPDYAPAHWLLGHVKYDNAWHTPEEVARQVNSSKLLQQYLKERNGVRWTVEGHFRLAQRCQKLGLTEERQAHLLAAARLEPNNANVQRALGRQLKDGKWQTPSERALAKSERDQALAAYRTWKPQLLAWRTKMQNRDESARQIIANEILREVRDPLAIPALEEEFSLKSETLALLTVKVLNQLQHQSATLSLVRHAVWSQWPSVRRAAINGLRAIPMDHYFDVLVGYLRPTESGQAWIRGLGHVWFWQDYDTTFVRGTWNNFTNQDLGSGSLRNSRITLRASNEQWTQRQNKQSDAQSAKQAEFEVVENQNQERLANTRTALRELTSLDHGDEPMPWRQWWAGLQKVFIDAEASEPVPERTLDFVVSDPEMVVFDPTLSGVVRRCSCFAAGTPVWTRSGFMAIDKIQPGDLVLSCEPTTGEIAYKPVVRVTVRPRTEMRQLSLQNETITGTLGHYFWRQEQGWTMLEKLKAGETLGAFQATYTISQLQPGRVDFAYNLEIADFATYYVGNCRLLVHDITPLRSVPR